ncbi:MAG: methyltransferase domain-containing protein [Pseudomonadota bacterium]
MSFTADWLGLREMYDIPARDKGLLEATGAWLKTRKAPLIADIGTGTGANVRALSPQIPSDARWRLIDRDEGLLETAERSARGTGNETEVHVSDLAQDTASAIEGADLVTASAFFDLVSESWLEGFVASLPQDAAVYAALTYNGEEEWRPQHADDNAVTDAFKAHQRTDKGFGPALGPAAGPRLAEMLRDAGYAVQVADSPWVLRGADDGFFIETLADGIAAAAKEIGADPVSWRAVERETVWIGHIDLFATPPG